MDHPPAGRPRPRSRRRARRRRQLSRRAPTPARPTPTATASATPARCSRRRDTPVQVGALARVEAGLRRGVRQAPGGRSRARFRGRAAHAVPERRLRIAQGRRRRPDGLDARHPRRRGRGDRRASTAAPTQPPQLRREARYPRGHIRDPAGAQGAAGPSGPSGPAAGAIASPCGAERPCRASGPQGHGALAHARPRASTGRSAARRARPRQGHATFVIRPLRRHAHRGRPRPCDRARPQAQADRVLRAGQGYLAKARLFAARQRA